MLNQIPRSIALMLLLTCLACARNSQLENKAPEQDKEIKAPSDGSEIVIHPEMSSSTHLSFADFPQGWNLASEGRLRDGLANEHVIDDPFLERTGKVLQVTYPKGTASPSYSSSAGLKGGGTQFISRSTPETDHMKLSYWYRFGEGFNCVKGGKLPGLASTGELISGGETPTGSNGFSVRLMWREDCKGEVYAYFPQKGNEHLAADPSAKLDVNSKTGKTYGWSLGRGTFTFPTSKWTLVEIEVRANTPGKNDGLVRVAVDSKEVYERSDFVMRDTDRIRLGRLFFSTFFGGSSQPYAAVKDEKIYFGDIILNVL